MSRWIATWPLAVTACLLLLTALPALACTEDRVLDLIGRLEAPEGYNQVYSGIRHPPPRPITTMSVADVLAWQRQTVRTSVSSAAGRYQIIRPTLERLVNEGVVSPSARFDAATQDHLGRHLLRETGYRNGDTSEATATRIAGVWAALPDLASGRSVYEGVAGNHALITAASWRGVLSCALAPADVALEMASIRAGARFGFQLDRALEEMAGTADRIMQSIATWAVSLLLGLFVIDLILRAGRWITGPNLDGAIGGLVMRLLVVLLCLAVLRVPGEVLGAVQTIANRLAGEVGARDVVLEDWLAGRMVLVFGLFEGLMAYSLPIRVSVQVLALLIVGLAAVQVALMLYWTLNLVLVGASGLLALGFGGLKETTGAAKSWAMHLAGAGLALFTALLIMTILTGFAWDMRQSARDPLGGALAALLMETVAVVLIFTLPRAVSKLTGGPDQKHLNPLQRKWGLR